MSGVEAIIGLVAGGAGFVSLAFQLMESTTKLKRIYHAAQDAPTTLSRLTFDLETMAMALRQLDQHRQAGTPTETLLARCIIACERATTQIKELVDKLETCLAGHKKIRGKLYTAFKQHDVRELLDNLENAKSSLHIAYTMHLAEEQKLRDLTHSNVVALQSAMICDLQTQMQMQTASLSDQLTLVAQAPCLSHHQHGNAKTQRPLASHLRGLAPIPEDKKDSLVNDRTNTRNPPRKSARTKSSKSRFRVTYQLPNWISRRTYDIALLQLQCGWDVLLRTYNVVHYDSLIFDFVEYGNLARVRGLIESGYATPLDVRPNYGAGLIRSFGPWQTLLEAAASFNQVDVCRYLLNQATWPDHDTVLSRSLGTFSYRYQRTPLRGSSNMYRLFMAEPDFDPALDNGLRYGWLQFCSSAAAMETILRSQAFTLETRPVQTRFELASRLENTDAATFLKCVGLDSSDPILTVLRNSKGKTVLHVVAHHLHLYSERRDAARRYQLSRAIQGWFDLGVSVLKNGANPSSPAEQDEESWLTSTDILETDNGPTPRPPGWSPGAELCTPSLVALGWDDVLITRRHLIFFKRKVEILQMWAEMVQSAGLGLCHYGASESEVWKSIVLDSPCSLFDSQSGHTAYKAELLYGATPEEWSFKVVHAWSIGLYKLQAPPGAFPTQSVVPTTIAWSPGPLEYDEGHWALVGRKQHRFNAGDVRHISPSSAEPFIDLVQSYQDDAGVITLMQYSASWQRSTRTRSHSQPPSLRRRGPHAYYTWRESRQEWLPDYHFCPGSSSWRFGCVSDEDRGGEYVDLPVLGHIVVDVRSCVKSVHTECSSVQQSYDWRDWSFLAGLADCQDNTALTGRDMDHLYECPWPEGCRNIQLDRLNVPEDLRKYHPYRRHFPDGDDDGENGGSVEG
ncbi:hypothetical protein G647_02868 [Cladophialophora carrionii CBS 160.54]|uniref:Fungal N-terminal domain-containing protein n=1 Tax=Cladophialophora carrionii CBS 160.54 TaxID=1279043 RepID=V9DHD3_9EURO|nr:uncharacterized protein G647_02868 [Cladophialophora carrionii CBS 160.54]ETI26091.1 hypothetical protein G647_02868 [Cladophialophora carrionii CBS 160.54]